jgi:electron transfer flavoprotein beta subunit
MKVLVPMKRIVDANVRIRLKRDGSGVELTMTANPFDEIAVEEAVRPKEAGVAAEVIVVGHGAQETLRSTLTICADRGLPKTDAAVEPYNCCKTAQT